MEDHKIVPIFDPNNKSLDSKIPDIRIEEEKNITLGWREALNKIQEEQEKVIEEKKKEKGDAFDKRLAGRDAICNKISAWFAKKLDIINSDPAIQELIEKDKFVVTKTVYNRLVGSNGELSNQRSESTSPFLDYRPVITEDYWNIAKDRIKVRLDMQREELAKLKLDLRDSRKLLESEKGRLRTLENKLKENKELDPKDIDNNEELKSKKKVVVELTNKVTFLDKLLRKSTMSESELSSVYSKVISKDVTMAEPIVCSVILTNMLVILNSNREELDEEVLDIINDPILDRELTGEEVKRIINVDSMDSVNMLRLQTETQYTNITKLVDEVLDAYYIRERIQEFLDTGESLGCLADIQTELLEHLYKNPSTDEDEEAVYARKKDENGNIVPLSNEHLSGIPLLVQSLGVFLAGGNVEQFLTASEMASEMLGELYFPLYKSIIEPYGKSVLDKIESIDKRILLFMYVLLSCFKLGSINLIITLSFKLV